MLRRLTALALVIAASVAFASTAQAHRLSGHPKSLQGILAQARAQVRHDQASGDNHWLARDRAYVRKLRAMLRPSLGPSWLVNAFLCIHRGEGSWSDPDDPYWGGLQMDRSFMYAYGRWAISRYGGYANVWPPGVQIAVAIAAYNAGRGFYPWPNTARRCGLI